MIFSRYLDDRTEQNRKDVFDSMMKVFPPFKEVRKICNGLKHMDMKPIGPPWLPVSKEFIARRANTSPEVKPDYLVVEEAIILDELLDVTLSFWEDILSGQQDEILKICKEKWQRYKGYFLTL